jgi:hypothetical protein
MEMEWKKIDRDKKYQERLRLVKIEMLVAFLKNVLVLEYKVPEYARVKNNGLICSTWKRHYWAAGCCLLLLLQLRERKEGRTKAVK